MSDDPARGKKIRWTYDDGPVKGMTFEHAFGDDGMVTYHQVDPTGAAAPAAEPAVHYEAERIDDHTFVVSYLAKNTWTLTTVVDTKTKRIVSFASNEKQLISQHGRLLD